MKKTKQKVSVSEKLMKVLTTDAKDAEEIRVELKDSLGFSEKLEDVRVNLLYLLRRGKIKRKKSGNVYKYYI